MASKGQKKSLLLVDLDGTLVDSAPDLAAAANKLLVELGLEPLPLAEVRAMIDGCIRVLGERLLKERGVDYGPEFLPAAVAKLRAYYSAAIAVETRPYPGVRETLESLRKDGWRLAVCTNKPEGLSRQLLEELQLDGHFEAVAGGDSFPAKKPDPAHPLGLLELLGGAPAESVLLGDGTADILAARAAGIEEIWFSGGYGGAGGEGAGPPLAARCSSGLAWWR